jgi:hypothetical protein
MSERILFQVKRDALAAKVVWVTDENPMRKTSRLYVFGAPQGDTRKESIHLMRVVAEEGLALMQFPEGPTKLVWNRTAGCSCGCSPAFEFRSEDNEVYDMYVEWSKREGE